MARIGLLVLAGVVSLVVAAPLAGQVEPVEGPTGTLVFLMDGNRFLSIDLATGDRRVRRMRGVAGCAPAMYSTGGHVVFSGVRKRRTVVLSVPASLDGPARVLGTAHAFVPSATDGRVWLAGVDCHRKRMVGVREVTVDGKETFRSSRPVPGTWVMGAVGRGLVLHRRGALVWNPRTGRSDRIGLRFVIATRGNLMAGCPKARRCGGLTIFDDSTSRLVRARAPQRLDLAAQFSPDATQLAAPALAGKRWNVALVQTQDGSTAIVPGSSTGEQYPYPTWTSSGWLVFRAKGGRLMAYRPGESGAVPLPFRWPRQARAYVAG